MNPAEPVRDIGAAGADVDDPRLVQALDEFLAALHTGVTPERQTFLAAHAEIAEQLARCLDGLEFIEGAGPALQESARTAAEPAAPEPGVQAVGDYRLIREIGRGGMGIVYEAEQLSLGRRVALKVLPLAATLDPRQLQRFKNESHAAAQLRHPNIVPVYATGSERGVHYYAMQLVDGRTLADLVGALRQARSAASCASADGQADTRAAPTTQAAQTQPVAADFRTIAQIGIQAADALEYAHQLGIIHRDIKPANILLESVDHPPLTTHHSPLTKVWITDFGLAQCRNRTGPTMTGDLVGTLRYMSPEQALANRAALDERTDVYSLGATLYELLTLEPVFAGQDSQELLRQIAGEEPRPPRRLRPEIPAELETIVLKALEKNPADRYGSAQALADDLRRYLRDEPIRARRATVWQRLRKWSRRHKAVVGSVSLAMLVSLAILAGSIGWIVRDRAAQQAQVRRQVEASVAAARTLIADNRLTPARQKLAEARGQLGPHGTTLADLADEVEAFAGELERYQRFLHLIDQAHEQDLAAPLRGYYDTEPDDPSPRAASLLLQALGCYGVLDRPDWRNELGHGFLGMEHTQQLTHRVYESLLYLTSNVLARYQDHRTGQPLTSDAAARRGLAYLAEAANVRAPTRMLYQLRSRCRHLLGDADAARADAALARDTPPALAVDHYLLGHSAGTHGPHAAAIKPFQEALALEPGHYWSLLWLGHALTGAKDTTSAQWTAATVAFTGCILRRPDHAEAYRGRAEAYARLGMHKQAVGDFSRSIALAPTIARSWHRRGDIHIQLRAWDQAVADHTRALELHPDYAFSFYWGRGSLRLSDRELADLTRTADGAAGNVVARSMHAIALAQRQQWEEALTDFTTAGQLDPRFAAVAAYNRAWVHLQHHQPERAAAESTRALELDPRHTDAYLTLRADAWRQLQQRDKALADYAVLLKRRPNNAPVHVQRGKLYLELGRHDEAMDDFFAAVRSFPHRAEYWLARGDAWMQLRRWDKASADYTTAVTKAPRDVAAWTKRGEACANLGQWRSALAWYGRAHELAGHLPEPATGLAWALVCIPDPVYRDFPRARALAQKIIAKYPKHGKAQTVLAVANYRLRQWRPALTALEKSVALPGGGDCTDWLFLAMTHARLGNNDEARRWYDMASAWIDANPPDAQLQRFRTEATQTLGLKPAP